MSQNFDQKSQIWFQILSSPLQDFNLRIWKPNHSMEWHHHDYLQLIHVLDGELEVDWGDGWYTLYPSDIHILYPRITHRLKTVQGHYQLGINFQPGPNTHPLLQSLLTLAEHKRILHFHLSDDWIQELVHISSLPYEWMPDLRQNYLEGYLWKLLQISLESSFNPEKVFQKEKILQLIESDPTKHWKVPQAARALGMSRATLERVCKQHFGKGFAKLQEQIRIQYAMDLLVHTPSTIEECAQRCGYQDQSTFSRSFLRIVGITPRDYRKKHEKIG